MQLHYPLAPTPRRLLTLKTPHLLQSMRRSNKEKHLRIGAKLASEVTRQAALPQGTGSPLCLSIEPATSGTELETAGVFISNWPRAGYLVIHGAIGSYAEFER